MTTVIYKQVHNCVVDNCAQTVYTYLVAIYNTSNDTVIIIWEDENLNNIINKLPTNLTA